jgi:hypothetical protein
MSDDKSHPGRPDHDRIKLEEEYEVWEWTNWLGVTERELRAAIASAGNSASSVSEYLDRRWALADVRRRSEPRHSSWEAKRRHHDDGARS